MGFFDKLKKTAQDAIKPAATQAAPEVEADEDEDEEDSEPEQAAASQPAYTGPTFRHDGDDLPLPPGWDGLSVDDFFFKLEMLRDRIMNASDEKLPPMKDEDGEPLDPEEVVLRLENFTSGGHYEKFRTWGVASWAQKLGEDHTNLEFKMGGIAREKIMKNKAGALSGAGGALEPVEGITCDKWAHINAALANGGAAKFDKLLADAGMDRPKWDRVSAEWMARMSTDTTMAIATVYGNAFSNSGEGQFSAAAGHAANVGVGGDLSNEPMPYEKFCEIEAAMGCASDRGEDVNVVLREKFGMSAIDWGQLGMFWSKKTQQDAMGYHKLYIEYHAKYKAQYSV